MPTTKTVEKPPRSITSKIITALRRFEGRTGRRPRKVYLTPEQHMQLTHETADPVRLIDGIEVVVDREPLKARLRDLVRRHASFVPVIPRRQPSGECRYEAIFHLFGQTLRVNTTTGNQAWSDLSTEDIRESLADSAVNGYWTLELPNLADRLLEAELRRNEPLVWADRGTISAASIQSGTITTGSQLWMRIAPTVADRTRQMLRLEAEIERDRMARQMEALRARIDTRAFGGLMNSAPPVNRVWGVSWEDLAQTQQPVSPTQAQRAITAPREYGPPARRPTINYRR